MAPILLEMGRISCRKANILKLKYSNIKPIKNGQQKKDATITVNTGATNHSPFRPLKLPNREH